MPFFAAAEGIVAPDPGQIKAVYEDEDSPKEPAREEWWKCLALLDSDTVGLGSNLCSFCILDVRPSQGYTTLYSWRSEVGLELLDMQFCRKTKEWWTLEKKLGESQNLMLVRYSDRPRKGERVAALISSNEAVLSVSINGTVTLSLPGGIVEFWRYISLHKHTQEIRRLGILSLEPILGVSMEHVLFTHAVLTGPVLTLGTSSDVWFVQLRRKTLQAACKESKRCLKEDVTYDTRGLLDCQSGGVGGLPVCHQGCPLGSFIDRDDMLDCALPEQDECYAGTLRDQERARPKWVPECPKDCPEYTEAAMVLARVKFHRPGYLISEIKIISVGSTWVELLLVSGQGACLYRVSKLRTGTHEDAVLLSSSEALRADGREGADGRDGAAVVFRLADLQFKTKVLATAKGAAAEAPWLFALTLSGIEVWCLPPSGHRPADFSSSRLLVQRLEYRQRLERLPPVSMVATGNAVIFLANPHGQTPPSLAEMLFHTVPRPSLARTPELSSGVLDCDSYDGPITPDGAFSIGYGLLSLQTLSLAEIYEQLRTEIMHALLMEEGMPEDGMEEDNEDFAATRFVEGEMLDSSVYGIQSPRIVYQSGTELLAILYAHLRLAADVGGMECSSIVWRSEEYKMDREGLNDDSIVERAGRKHVEKLYRQQQKDCATILGMLCLDPRAEGVSSDTLQACDWFSDSNTPLLTVCIKLLKSRTKKDASATKEQQQTRPMARAESAALRRDPAELLVHFLRKRCSRMDNWIEEKRLEEKRPCPIIEGRSSLDIWSDVLTLCCDIGEEKFLSWAVLHSWLPRLPECRDVLRHIIDTRCIESREKLLMALVK